MTKLKNKKQFENLVDFLRTKRETILNSWREICAQDSSLSSKASFSREEFNDQVPVLLNILERGLLNASENEDVTHVASEHGLHRWQSGYDLHELIVEFEHLFRVIMDEIQIFLSQQGEFTAESTARLYNTVFSIYSSAVKGSVMYYDQLRQSATAERAASLQNALDQLMQLSNKRSEHLRHSSHDLRSSFSALMMTTQLWKLPTSEKERAELMGIFNRNLTTIRDLLLQLTDYARIEAGQETLRVREFDVSKLLNSLIEDVMPLAQEKKIILQGTGPKHMVITSDSVQIQRVFQNLLHNALKYTHEGGVYVTWAAESESRWILSVQDTGPGFAKNSALALLADQLKPSILSTAVHVDGRMLQQPVAIQPDRKASETFKESEGLGLFIVKKICELMKATMDIESEPGKGTLIRIRFQAKQEV